MSLGIAGIFWHSVTKMNLVVAWVGSVITEDPTCHAYPFIAEPADVRAGKVDASDNLWLVIMRTRRFSCLLRAIYPAKSHNLAW